MRREAAMAVLTGSRDATSSTASRCLQRPPERLLAATSCASRPPAAAAMAPPETRLEKGFGGSCRTKLIWQTAPTSLEWRAEGRLRPPPHSRLRALQSNVID